MKVYRVEFRDTLKGTGEMRCRKEPSVQQLGRMSTQYLKKKYGKVPGWILVQWEVKDDRGKTVKKGGTVFM